MNWRGAVSPRSDSPIGPAPTRVPRIALPPDMAMVADPQLDDQTGTDERDHPDRAHEQREPVEVALDDAGTGEAGLHTAAEQRGQAPAPSAGQEGPQRQPPAGD